MIGHLWFGLTGDVWASIFLWIILIGALGITWLVLPPYRRRCRARDERARESLRQQIRRGFDV